MNILLIFIWLQETGKCINKSFEIVKNKNILFIILFSIYENEQNLHV